MNKLQRDIADARKKYLRTIAIADRMIKAADRGNESEEDVFDAMCVLVSSFIDLSENERRRELLWKLFVLKTGDLLEALDKKRQHDLHDNITH